MTSFQIKARHGFLGVCGGLPLSGPGFCHDTEHWKKIQLFFMWRKLKHGLISYIYALFLALHVCIYPSIVVPLTPKRHLRIILWSLVVGSDPPWPNKAMDPNSSSTTVILLLVLPDIQWIKWLLFLLILFSSHSTSNLTGIIPIQLLEYVLTYPNLSVTCNVLLSNIFWHYVILS